MHIPQPTDALEAQIDQWRSYLQRRQAIHPVDVAELEDHLREQVEGLTTAGLADDEAFLVAVKRMGDLDTLSREFAREHSERLWKQMVVASHERSDERSGSRSDAFFAFGLALAAGASVKLPALFGIGMETDAEASIYLRNASFFVLPLLTVYFAWKRQLSATTVRWLALIFAISAVFANVYPFTTGSSTQILSILHMPMALWLVVGVAYAGTRWRDVAGRMDFIRFSGELFIYFVLMALGGGVLTATTLLIFSAVGIDLEFFAQEWLIPCGAAGAVVVGAWLVEAKQSVIENMVPVLTRLFTPMFALLLVVFLGTLLVTGRGWRIERDMLIAFDLLLALVLALLLYSASARDPMLPPGPFDVVQVVLVISALLTDLVALWAIGARISEYGFTANRVAALGENLILLVNLGWSAVLYLRFVRGRGAFSTLERWQTRYLPVYAIWASIVVIVFPLLFGFSD